MQNLLTRSHVLYKTVNGQVPWHGNLAWLGLAWVQEFSWGEDELETRRRERMVSMQRSKLQKEPMFCFETYLKVCHIALGRHHPSKLLLPLPGCLLQIMYWSGYVSNHRCLDRDRGPNEHTETTVLICACCHGLSCCHDCQAVTIARLFFATAALEQDSTCAGVSI